MATVQSRLCPKYTSYTIATYTSYSRRTLQMKFGYWPVQATRPRSASSWPWRYQTDCSAIRLEGISSASCTGAFHTRRWQGLRGRLTLESPAFGWTCAIAGSIATGRWAIGATNVNLHCRWARATRAPARGTPLTSHCSTGDDHPSKQRQLSVEKLGRLAVGRFRNPLRSVIRFVEHATPLPLAVLKDSILSSY